ncbi:MAG: UDP-N-acetylglucosamine 2-epimerase (non-hydrolyzing) [Comamonadaceae bacterium]|jgi:UDP-N-acetylglucosamine 2-epimerase (non-hydrolysing)|nr:UDP-N-acetylglucosamine 2-epimerase (non-hydrolyzing) [Comamonadaceae bacterium]
MPKLLYLVAGARPNFMKIAPIIRALQRRPEDFAFRLVHTGQHYDREMSGVFFEELGIPAPDHHLDCGGGSHAEQTAKIMVAFEKICTTHPPDCVLVVGDVNSTLACAIVAKKLQLPVAHVEAGLRSGDRTMPEEINRLVTDSISDWFFCTEPAGVDNLRREGQPENAIFHVGHVMVDNLLYQKQQLEQLPPTHLASGALKARLGGRYGVVTLHRPANVDDGATLARIASALNTLAAELPLVFPVHPRTREQLQRLTPPLSKGITLLGPQPYMEFLNLWKDATLVLTDSGGLQEETTALGVPCLTLRDNTERPVTVQAGSNTLVGTDPGTILRAAQGIVRGQAKRGHSPALWDGRAAERIVAQLQHCLAKGAR